MELVKNILDKRLLISLVAVLITIAIIKLKQIFVNRKIKKANKTKFYKKQITYTKLINSIFSYVIALVAIFFILKLYGVNVTSIVAGIGVVSVVIGLALQDALKDVIMGLNIIFDNYFSVGDVIKLNDIEGLVLEIGIKITKLQDIYTENVYVVANRNISQAIIMSSRFDVDVPLPYNQPVEKIEEIMQNIVKVIATNKYITKANYEGLNNFNESSIDYKLRVWCLPELKPAIRRFVLRETKLILDKNGIEIPFNQMDVHIDK